MPALADIHADKYVDGVRMSWVLHISVPAMSREHIPTDHDKPASASRLQVVSDVDRSSISDRRVPTGSGDNTPGIMVEWGRESCRTRLAQRPPIGAGRRWRGRGSDTGVVSAWPTEKLPVLATKMCRDLLTRSPLDR